jgi:DNA-binding response OmpR family regulator
MEPINKKILIVEDDKAFLWILKQNFCDEGFEVVYAENGQEGLEMALSEKPDLILSDILMPKMDGVEMVKKIKEGGLDTKIIFLTNFKDSEHISKVMEIMGETEYIVKSDLHGFQIVDRVKRKLGLT